MLEYFQNVDRGEVKKKKNQMNDCILHQFLPTIVTHSISHFILPVNFCFKVPYLPIDFLRTREASTPDPSMCSPSSE